MSREWGYLNIGGVLGAIAGFLAFAASWIYCIATYGFLIGVSVGWIPAAIVGGIVGLAVTLLWGPVLILCAAGYLYVSADDRKQAAKREQEEAEYARLSKRIECPRLRLPNTVSYTLIPGPNKPSSMSTPMNGDHLVVSDGRRYERISGCWEQISAR